MTNASPEKSQVTRLEEEGEIAADYLEELMDIVDLDGDIDLDIHHDRAAVEIVSEDSPGSLDALVGQDGEVLEALQDLTRLAVMARTGERSRLMLDVAGYRARRRSELEAEATAVISQVKEGGSAVSMRPMNAFERKVVHDVVAEQGLVSDSAGTEPQRHVVVHPAAPTDD
ncbi:protein jag [Isoptericola jiangsuensis]|uniref:Jag family protein n=1 Tax=Isoptericola jiangsuensis TaxID=548579 RepID=UPI003AABEC0B